MLLFPRGTADCTELNHALSGEEALNCVCSYHRERTVAALETGFQLFVDIQGTLVTVTLGQTKRDSCLTCICPEKTG